MPAKGCEDPRTSLVWDLGATLSQFLQHLINMLVLGGTYALLGIGLTLIFGIMNAANFTHGVLYTFGAYIMFIVVHQLGVNFFLALPLAVVAGWLLGAAIELKLLRPLRLHRHDAGDDRAWIALSPVRLGYGGALYIGGDAVSRRPPVIVSAGFGCGCSRRRVPCGSRRRDQLPISAATRRRDAGDVPGPGHRLADGRQRRSHLHLDLRDRFEPCCRSRRAAGPGSTPSSGRWAISRPSRHLRS